ncbi:MAG: hypothetical protein NT154_21245, partial [Verrucomicrobia bacterium]|nr:hypothetical protein [Verrucomicrobiota bacterium]
FTVTINGTPVLQRLDLVATAGLLKPYDKTFPVVATSGQIQVVFTGNVGNAVISGIQVDSVDTQAPPTLAFACEGGWVADGGVDGIGGIFPATYAMHTCENMSASPYRILRARCRSNVAGPTFDVLAPDAANVYKSVLAAPMACAPEGVNTTVLPNSSYAAGHVLKFVFIIPEGQLVREVMGAVVLEEDHSPAKLASLRVCTGSGLSVDPQTGKVYVWDCAGLWHASIIAGDGSLLSLFGIDEPWTTPRPEVTWAHK